MTLQTAPDFDKYKRVQDIARKVLQDVTAHIAPGVTEADLVEICHRLMIAHGASGFWGSIPALVLAGPNLRQSVAGVSYRPSIRPIEANDMITIDVGVQLDECMGDCARSYFLRDGLPVSAEAAGAEQAEGIAAELALHARVMEYARPDMAFRELYREMDRMVQELGFRNLDFMANYGHSIEAINIAGVDGQRIDGVLPELTLIDAECERRLDDVPFFTFEPHIAKPGSPLAFKHEEMYRFGDNRLIVV